MLRLSLFLLFNASLAPHIVYHTKADKIITKEISLAVKRFNINEKLVFQEVDSLKKAKLVPGNTSATVFGFEKGESSWINNENILFYQSTLTDTIQQDAVKFDRITIAGKPSQVDENQVTAANFFCYDDDLRTFYESSEGKYKSMRKVCIDRKSSDPTLLLDVKEGKKTFQFKEPTIQRWKNSWIYRIAFQNEGYNEVTISFPEKVELLSKPFMNNQSMENQADLYRSKNLLTENTLTIVTLNEKLREITIEGYKNEHFMEATTIPLNQKSYYPWFFLFLSLFPILLYLKKTLRRKNHEISSYSNRLAEGQTMSRADLPAAMQTLVPDFTLFNLGGKIVMKDDRDFTELVTRWKTLGLKVKITDEKYKELTGGVNKSLKIKFQI